jgi:hypothetical protein
MSTDDVPELAIPDEAKEAFWRILDSRSIDGQMVGVISEWSQIAYRLVVATELERLATYYEPETDVEDYDQGEEDQREAVRSICRALRKRAAELRATSAKEDGNA